jgi:S-adenosylmethionine decarboxylase
LHGGEVLSLSPKKMTLYGFNNLTKTLSFNIYDVCYTRTAKERKAYIDYVDEQYGSERLTQILIRVADIIGAHVLNIAKQDYDPMGASVTVMISESKVASKDVDASCNEGVVPRRETVVGHLDKSHLTVHTYPESHPGNDLSTFRVDIDVSTCGEVSPLNALNFLIGSFDSDIIILDYRIRGFTRDVDGKKLFLDHPITSIRDYIAQDILDRYSTIDVNLHHANIFHTQMMIDRFVLDNYTFAVDPKPLSDVEIAMIKQRVNQEIVEIFYGMNIPKME